MSNDFFTTSNRIKSTPFSSRNQKAGVKKYSIYNNTLIPTIFKSLKSDYLHLIKHVQLWDVCAQKVIEVKGNKALGIIKYLFCRDFTKVTPGRAYYAPIVNFEGGLLNDPVVFCINEEHFLISLSDSDLFNWASAINHTKEFFVEVNETDIITMAIQGPKSEQTMLKIFGEEIKFENLRFSSYSKNSILVPIFFSNSGSTFLERLRLLSCPFGLPKCEHMITLLTNLNFSNLFIVGTEKSILLESFSVILRSHLKNLSLIHI